MRGSVGGRKNAGKSAPRTRCAFRTAMCVFRKCPQDQRAPHIARIRCRSIACGRAIGCAWAIRSSDAGADNRVMSRPTRIPDRSDVPSLAPSPLRSGVSDRRDVLPLSLPPRGLSRVEAAAYVGVSPSLFDAMVADHRMPSPKLINARVVLDRLKLDEAFSALPDRDG